MLARDKVRFIGEAIAVVVAEYARAGRRRGRARRGRHRRAAGARRHDQGARGRRADPLRRGRDEPRRRGAARRRGALDDAEVVVSSALRQPAPRRRADGAGARRSPRPDPETGGVLLYAPLQAPHMARRPRSPASLGLEQEKIRVTVPTVGGGFGARIATLPRAGRARRARAQARHARCATSRRRWETMLAMQHGRAQVQDVELGATRDGKITGLKRARDRRLRRLSRRRDADAAAHRPDGVAACTQIPKVDFALPRRSSPTRRRSAPTAAPAARRRRRCSSARWTCSPPSSGMDPAELRRQELHPARRVPADQTVDGRQLRLGRVRAGAGQGAGERRLRRAARRAGRAARARRRQAARHRPLRRYVE